MSSSNPQTEPRTAQQVATGLLSSPRSETSKTPSGQIDPAIVTAVNRVFAVFNEHWLRKFSTLWPTPEAVERSKRVWARAFARCDHLTAQTIAAGLERVVTMQWPPDNPGEFLQLCHRTPEMLDAPGFDAAHTEACRGAYPYSGAHRWSHRCVYWAATWTGLSDLNERPNAVRKRFDREYQRALDQFETLTEAPKANLPAPVECDGDVTGTGFQNFLKAKEQLFGGAK
jgi:hypothetical protein